MDKTDCNLGVSIIQLEVVAIDRLSLHRYSYRKINFDLLADVEAGICLKSKELGRATTNHKDYIRVENDKPKPSIDFRPGAQLKVQIKKVGFLAGYSIGLTNYQTKNNSKAYSRFLRFGLSYLLN